MADRIKIVRDDITRLDVDVIVIFCCYETADVALYRNLLRDILEPG
ncbi:MAG: hypothetical protein ACHRXM_27830 [Isosphaerales bacterium]